MSEWQPIATAPKGLEALFWVVPKQPSESFCDSSGKPICVEGSGRLLMGKFGQWSSLEKATNWQPPPSSPGSRDEAIERCICGGPMHDVCNRYACRYLDTQARPSDDEIRAVFLANGFTIKDGQTDLKPYVYQAARALLSAALPPPPSPLDSQK